MPACVIRSSIPPGSGSGTGYSSISNGSPWSLKTTTRPVLMASPHPVARGREHDSRARAAA